MRHLLFSFLFDHLHWPSFSLSEILQEVRLTPFLDTEAVCSDGETDEDDDGNLKGFVVNDDVVEYDVDAPALPDDDVVRPKR